MKGILRVEDDSGDEKPLKKKSSKTKKTEPIHVAETELPVISYLNGEEETQSMSFMSSFHSEKEDVLIWVKKSLWRPRCWIQERLGPETTDSKKSLAKETFWPLESFICLKELTNLTRIQMHLLWYVKLYSSASCFMLKRSVNRSSLSWQVKSRFKFTRQSLLSVLELSSLFQGVWVFPVAMALSYLTL